MGLTGNGACMCGQQPPFMQPCASPHVLCVSDLVHVTALRGGAPVTPVYKGHRGLEGLSNLGKPECTQLSERAVQLQKGGLAWPQSPHSWLGGVRWLSVHPGSGGSPESTVLKVPRGSCWCVDLIWSSQARVLAGRTMALSDGSAARPVGQGHPQPGVEPSRSPLDAGALAGPEQGSLPIAGSAGRGSRLCGQHALPLPQRRQHTSVFLDNASSSPVTVRSGSHFSAVFLGI